MRGDQKVWRRGHKLKKSVFCVKILEKWYNHTSAEKKRLEIFQSKNPKLCNCNRLRVQSFIAIKPREKQMCLHMNPRRSGFNRTVLHRVQLLVAKTILLEIKTSIERTEEYNKPFSN